MQTMIYDSIPLLLSDGGKQQEFLLRYNDSTQSFRLEGGRLRRSIFIGYNAFNRLFQFYRNEYGFTLGKVQYENRNLQKGVATTSDNRRYRFTMSQMQGICIEIEEERNPDTKIKAIVSSSLPPSKNKYLNVLIPSVLTALLYAGEASLTT